MILSTLIETLTLGLDLKKNADAKVRILDHHSQTYLDIAQVTFAADGTFFIESEEPQAHDRDSLSDECTRIADQVVPQYRSGTPPYPSCTGTIAKRWQAAWDGACVALGGDPKEYPG